MIRVLKQIVQSNATRKLTDSGNRGPNRQSHTGGLSESVVVLITRSNREIKLCKGTDRDYTNSDIRIWNKGTYLKEMCAADANVFAKSSSHTGLINYYKCQDARHLSSLFLKMKHVSKSKEIKCKIHLFHFSR